MADDTTTDGTEEQERRRIDRILDDDFLEGLDEMPIDELRSRRALCDEVDVELSYYRRLLHGRMDLLAFELRRRRGEEERSLIEALPEILSGPPAPRTSRGRNVPVALPDLPAKGRREIDRVLDDDFLAHLPTLDEEELASIRQTLTDAETEISEQRRRVYEVYEQAQAELTRRYREGLADVDELLRDG